MRSTLVGNFVAVSLFLAAVLPSIGQEPADSSDYHVLVKEGEQALARNEFRAAAQVFQRAADINPSSAKAHEGLGIALFRELAAGNVRASSDSDVAERSETHLKQAASLSPGTARPLLELADLEGFLAGRSPDDQRSDRYEQARRALKQAIELEPSQPQLYLRLANLERDEFGPVLEQAKARYPKNVGPIPDASMRANLREHYLDVINDAISNAQRASEANANSQRPLLLLSKLFRQRALLRDTQEQYATDMHTAADWEQQFVSTGGHVTGEVANRP